MNPKTSQSAVPHSFTLVELLVIVVTLAVLFCFLIPSMVREKRRRVCQNNLRQIGLAFKTWPKGSVDWFPMQAPVKEEGTKELVNSGQVYIHFRAISNELAGPKVLICPTDRSKIPAKEFRTGFSDANVSYFVGADANDTLPQAFLSGDRNLAVRGCPCGPDYTP